LPKKPPLTAAENRERIALENSREEKREAKRKQKRVKKGMAIYNALDRETQIAKWEQFWKDKEQEREDIERWAREERKWKKIVDETIKQLDIDFPMDKPVFEKGQTASRRGGVYISKKRRE